LQRGVSAMNHSRFPTLAAAAAALATQMAFAPGAHARVVPIIHDSTLTGIDGLDVDGTLYDMTFVRDTGDRPPPPADFKGPNDADAASRVLGKELVALEDKYLMDHRSVLYFKGCPDAEIVFDCGILTPDRSPSVFGAELAFVYNIIAFDRVFTVDTAPTPTNNRFVGYDYAVWTTVHSAPVVPEPSPLVLLGVGMAGVAAAGALRRRTKPA
jgi:PEP-CTERM motif